VISQWIGVVRAKSFPGFHGNHAVSALRNWALRHIHSTRCQTFRCGVIIHTPWAGQPPSIIEDQVTTPSSRPFSRRPHVKAVEHKPCLGDSYVFGDLEDTTDLYWARIRVYWSTAYKSTGRLPAAPIPLSGGRDPAQDGFMNMCLWTIVIQRSFATCGAFKIGICATNSKLSGVAR